MNFEQWWRKEANLADLQMMYVRPLTELAREAFEAGMRYSLTENAPTVEDVLKEKSEKFGTYASGFKAGWEADKFAREEFLAEARKKGYTGVQHYITIMAECYGVPLDVARSCFIAAGSYDGAFEEFIELLKEWKRKTGK